MAPSADEQPELPDHKRVKPVVEPVTLTAMIPRNELAGDASQKVLADGATNPRHRNGRLAHASTAASNSSANSR